MKLNKLFKVFAVVLVLSMILVACKPAPVATEAPKATEAPAAAATEAPAATAAALVTSGGYVLPAFDCAPNCEYKDLTVGFIQTGSESGWRGANTSSFKDTAEQLGVTLKFYEAQNKLENQVSAFHQTQPS